MLATHPFDDLVAEVEGERPETDRQADADRLLRLGRDQLVGHGADQRPRTEREHQTDGPVGQRRAQGEDRTDQQ